MKIRVVAAQAPDSIAIEKDGRLLLRTPYGPDTPIPWDGDVERGIVAMVTKWGFFRVLDKAGNDRIEMGDNQVPLLEPVELPTGEQAFRVTQIITDPDPESANRSSPIAEPRVVVPPPGEQLL